MIRGSKRIFNDFVRTVKQDSHRYYYIKSNLLKMREENIDINTQIYGGQTLLHVALKLKNIRLFKLFLKYGVNPDIANDLGEAPIHKAILKNEFNFLKALVGNGCDINLGAELEQTPLHLAVITGNVDIVKYLVDNNARILIQDENYNYPLDYAIDEGDCDIIKYFLTKQEVDETRKEKINQLMEKAGEKEC